MTDQMPKVMKSNSSVLKGVVFIVLFGLFTTGIYQVTQNNNLGSDFFVSWHAGRMVILDHQTPYGEEAARINQLSVYKRLAREGEDEMGFAYPLYVLIPVLPLALLPYPLAQSLWIALLFLTLSSALLTVKQSAPAILLPFTCFYYSFFFGIILGNYAILLAALWLFILYTIYHQTIISPSKQVILGIILAWSTAKPQLTWLYILTIIFFIFHNKWWSLLKSFIISLGGMVLLSFILRPTWFTEWLAEIARYSQYNQALPNLCRYLITYFGTSYSIIMTGLLGIICLILILILMVRVHRNNKSPLLLINFVGFTSFLLHPTTHSYEQVAFLIPFLLTIFNLPKKGLIVLLWLTGLLVSWLAFFLSIEQSKIIVDALPFLAFCVWLLFQFRSFDSPL